MRGARAESKRMKSVDYKGDGTISRLRFSINTEVSYQCRGSGIYRAGQKVDPKPKYICTPHQ